MKRFNKKSLGISTNYALKAALYRRLARKMGGSHTFSAADLLELYYFESKGTGSQSFDQMKKTNGFAYGKWLRDIDCSTMVEAISSGEFCKIEFLGTAIERIHNTLPLRAIVVYIPWFPYQKEE